MSADLTLDPDELAAAFSSKTKAVLLNTPNNPTGKVFERKELEMIADLCKKHDAICVSDEVYEYLVYEGEHIRIGMACLCQISHNRLYYIATLPGMWERTLTIGSAGKAFSVTGWKVEYFTCKIACCVGILGILDWLDYWSCRADCSRPLNYGKLQLYLCNSSSGLLETEFYSEIRKLSFF